MDPKEKKIIEDIMTIMNRERIVRDREFNSLDLDFYMKTRSLKIQLEKDDNNELLKNFSLSLEGFVNGRIERIKKFSYGEINDDLENKMAEEEKIVYREINKAIEKFKEKVLS